MSVVDPEVHALTGAYVCDALGAVERAAFEKHLAVCATCALEVTELRETVARLALAVAETPPLRLKTVVDAAIGRVRQLPPLTTEPEPDPGPVRPRRRRALSAFLGWGVAAAMSAAVAVLGIHVADQHDRIATADRQNTTISALAAAPDAHAATATVQTGGTAIVVVSPHRDEAAITITGLTPPPPHQRYQLWMMGPDGTHTTGTLPPGTTNTVIAHNLNHAQTIGLTLEPEHGSPQPTTPLILQLPMPT